MPTRRFTARPMVDIEDKVNGVAWFLPSGLEHCSPAAEIGSSRDDSSDAMIRAQKAQLARGLGLQAQLGPTQYHIFASDGRAQTGSNVVCKSPEVPARPTATFRDVLPFCDAESDVRVRRDCALAHYKFFVASELDEQHKPQGNQIDDGLFMTHELWEGLVAGSVPIYWGGACGGSDDDDDARCYLDLLPHPDAVVDARAFPSAKALAEYVTLALADDTVYEKHHEWRDMEPHEWNPKFWDLVARSAPSVLCRVCDAAVELTSNKRLQRDGSPPRIKSKLGGTQVAGGARCSSADVNVHFVTFGSGKYVTAVDRIVDEAKRTGRFCAIHAYRGERDLPGVVLGDERFDWHRAQPRGGGYWYWKSCLVLEVLKSLKTGDVVFFADSGCELGHSRAALAEIDAMLSRLMPGPDSVDVVAFAQESIERQYTKGDVFDEFGMDPLDERTSLPQLLGGVHFIRRNANTILLLEKWRSLCAQGHLIGDASSKLPNHPQFIEGRHDQSLWSLLIKANDYIPPCSASGGDGAWLTNSPAIAAYSPHKIEGLQTQLFSHRATYPPNRFLHFVSAARNPSRTPLHATPDEIPPGDSCETCITDCVTKERPR